MNTARAFAAYETIGIGIPNPRAVTRVPVPPDLTPEQLAELEAWIDETNARLDTELKAEIEHTNRWDIP